jgi:hypothetical protein
VPLGKNVTVIITAVIQRSGTIGITAVKTAEPRNFQGYCERIVIFSHMCDISIICRKQIQGGLQRQEKKQRDPP